MRMKAIRTVDAVEIESKTFDYTFDRSGWNFNFDKYFNGVE